MAQNKRATVTVTSGEMTFSPVRYNTFQVGSVSVQVECELDDLDKAMEQAGEKVRAVFAKRYQERLDFYVKALHHNDKRLREDRDSRKD